MVSEVVSIWKLSHGMTKQTKWSVCPAKTQISLGIRPAWPESALSAWSKLGPKLPIEHTAKTLIRLGGCPGGSKSSLGTNVILLVLSWGGSKDFFLESTYAAHIHFITFFTFRIEPKMKSFSHANNIVLRRDIYIHCLNWC